MTPGLPRSHLSHRNRHTRTVADVRVLVLCILVFFCAHAAAAPASPIIDTSPDTGNLTVFDPNTLQPIPQFSASDGGSGKLVTILWVLFGLAVGGPLAILGVRAGRISTGAAIGFAGTVSIWAAFVNSLPMPLAATPNTADLVLTLILFAAFAFLTFLGAFLRTMHPIGLGLLGATGGTSLFMRVVLFRPDLLIPLRLYPLNLALLGAGALFGGILIIWKRRLMVMLATSLISTFLLGLSLDLILNISAPPQEGMSRGLRLLMDRNPTHLADIVGTHYDPTLKTQVILAVSLGLVPVFAVAQHLLFPGPFVYDLRRSGTNRESTLSSSGPDFRPNRPFNDKGIEITHLPISGPMFGVVGHGSRFSV